MKKIFFIFLFSLLVIPNFVLAAPNIGVETAKNIAGQAGYEPANEYTLSETVGRYIRVVLSLAGTIFLGLTVYAGFLWMTASGNEDQVTKATDIIKTAVIGLIITLAAFSITAFVISRIGVSTQQPITQAGGTGNQPAGNAGPGFWESWWGGVKKQASTSPFGESK